MIICICSNINDKEIKDELKDNKDLTFKELTKRLSIGQNCGKCLKYVKELYNDR